MIDISQLNVGDRYKELYPDTETGEVEEVEFEITKKSGKEIRSVRIVS